MKYILIYFIIGLIVSTIFSMMLQIMYLRADDNTRKEVETFVKGRMKKSSKLFNDNSEITDYCIGAFFAMILIWPLIVILSICELFE